MEEVAGRLAGLGAAALGRLDLGAQVDRSMGEGSGELLCSSWKQRTQAAWAATRRRRGEAGSGGSALEPVDGGAPWGVVVVAVA